MAGTLQLTGICSVAVQVRDLGRSLAFHCDVLGLPLGQGEGRIAQLHGHGDPPGRSSCLRWAGVPSTTPPRQASAGSRGGSARRRTLTWPSACSSARCCRASAGRRRAAISSIPATLTGPTSCSCGWTASSWPGTGCRPGCKPVSEPGLAASRAGNGRKPCTAAEAPGR